MTGPGLLQQLATLPRDVEHSGRSSGSRKDSTGLGRWSSRSGECLINPGVEDCVLRTTRQNEPDQRNEVVTRPLLGDGTPAERILQRRGRTIGSTYHAEDLLILRCHVSKRPRLCIPTWGCVGFLDVQETGEIAASTTHYHL